MMKLRPTAVLLRVMSLLATLIGGGHSASAQASLPVVALLRATGNEAADWNRTFSEALRAAGHENGRTIRLLEYSAGNDPGQLPSLAEEIVARRPDVIIGMGPAASKALKAATSSIPVVAHTGFPVEVGLAASLARPGGNVTGVSVITNQLDAKRLSLLGEFLPDVKRIAILRDRAGLYYLPQVDAEARRFGMTVDDIEVEKPSDIGPAMQLAKSRGAQAVNVLASPMLAGSTKEVAEQAQQVKLPTMCQWREMAKAGCLFSYGPPLLESYRLAAVQMDRLLKGANPAELPIVQPTHFELVINMLTARGMGIDFSPAVLARADEVIE